MTRHIPELLFEGKKVQINPICHVKHMVSSQDLPKKIPPYPTAKNGFPYQSLPRRVGAESWSPNQAAVLFFGGVGVGVGGRGWVQ